MCLNIMKNIFKADLLFFIVPVGNITKVTSVDHSINKPSHKKNGQIGQEQFHRETGPNRRTGPSLVLSL